MLKAVCWNYDLSIEMDGGEAKSQYKMGTGDYCRKRKEQE
jgi:hypothetical protein